MKASNKERETVDQAMEQMPLCLATALAQLHRRNVMEFCTPGHRAGRLHMLYIYGPARQARGRPPERRTVRIERVTVATNAW